MTKAIKVGAECPDRALGRVIISIRLYIITVVEWERDLVKFN
jgi:hypothetical protein